jgi:feruloyl-CoA synthase
MRPVRIASIDTLVRHGPDGAIYLRSPVPLGPYPLKITERLEHWARNAPDRAFLAQRDQSGAWRTISYAEALASVRRLSQAFLDRRLSADRRIVVLSGNSIEHALIALASMYSGIIYAPIAPAYSLQAHDFGTLGQVFDRVQPALVFAAEGALYERAVTSVLPAGAELVVSTSFPDGLAATPFAELEQTAVAGDVDEAHSRVGAETIAKILFTSGSTGTPKGVVNTQRMLCSNQEMLRSVIAFLADEPPILCDWLPWNHTAGGNHNFGLVLYNGGTLFIDEGKPTPATFGVTLANLRDVAATAHFTVPRTYEMLMPHLRTDRALRDRFFSKLKLLFYAAAGLGQRFWDELREVTIDACGEEILIMTGFGATETAPFALSTGADGAASGILGLPAPGIDFKLAPVGSKMEGRLRGPNVTPGYWRDEALTRAAFDEEGYYRLGDAMRLVDVDPGRALLFDGRLTEDFKLSTGTWVSVGPLRTLILQHCAGDAQDVVIAGRDRASVAALVFPNLQACRALCGDLPPDAPAAAVVSHARVRERFQARFNELGCQSTGSSTFVARAVLLDRPPSLDAREVTDKGSINQKAVLQNRAALVDELYASPVSARVIVVVPGAVQPPITTP